MKTFRPKSKNISPLPVSRLHTSGRVAFAVCPPGVDAIGSIAKLEKVEGVRVYRTHNLETAFVLEAIAKSLAGESGGIENIAATQIAIGSSSTQVLKTNTEIEMEILRKEPFIARSGATVSFQCTLAPGEAVGVIGTVGLFNGDSETGSTATGSITVGGTPAGGDSIVVAIKGRALPPYWVSEGESTDTIALNLQNWLNGDSYFKAFYLATATESVVDIESIGKGTGYNKALTATTVGGVTATATGMTGGATPGGNLLAAANTNFVKEAGSQVLVEWTIDITN